MSFLVRIHDTQHQRVWFELRDTESEMSKLHEVVGKHHPHYRLDVTELDHETETKKPWVKKTH